MTYNGVTDFAGSSTSIAQTVDQDGTTTSLASSVDPSTYGQAVTFTATVTSSVSTSSTAEESVTFYDGTTLLGTGTLSSSGVATYTTTPFQLSLGSGQSITAVYGGDQNFAGSTSAVLSQTVNQDGTTTTLASSVNPSDVGQSVTFTATITANSPGSGTPSNSDSVTFFVNSKSVTAVNLNDGVATYTTAFAVTGSDTIKAVFGGDTDYKTSSATLTQTVSSGGSDDAIVMNSVPGAVHEVLGTFSADNSSGSPIDELALDLLTISEKKSRAAELRHIARPSNPFQGVGTESLSNTAWAGLLRNAKPVGRRLVAARAKRSAAPARRDPELSCGRDWCTMTPDDGACQLAVADIARRPRPGVKVLRG